MFFNFFQFYSIEILLHVCNREEFGYITEPVSNYDYYNSAESFVHLRTEHLIKGVNKTYLKPLATSQFIDLTSLGLKKRKTKLGFDKIYIINLKRREDRRQRIESTLNDMNINYEIFEAIDAQNIDLNYIKSLGIKIIPNYKDPYSDRSMNYGEIGCFLSHYFIWKETVEKKLNKIIILEDDARFELNFKSLFTYLINQMNEKKIDWEMLYLGRKQMKNFINDEYIIDAILPRDGFTIVKPSYTHWTLAYALTLSGARQLINSEPLNKILPVDEFLPIMFDKQPK
jgi:collagen beta-1,O-galactosyltransferase